MKLRLKVLSLILALFVAIFATGTVFAWFSSQQWNLDITGHTAGAYFAYGDGTEFKKDSQQREIGEGKPGDPNDWDVSTGPFGITLPAHMFNLAWLQNTGRFKNDDDIVYHFELAADVDMWDSAANTNVVLPPIGNTENPFEGTFDGNGHTISNLIISTNKKVLYGNPASPAYTFSNAVGLFGMTDEYSVIKNFILEYPTVEVSDNANGAETKYDEPSDTDPTVVGIAVGYVAGTVHSIGVLGGTLAVRKTDYKTYNSILGTLTGDAADGDHNITGSGPGNGGSGNQFGANFDVEGVWARFENIAQNYDNDGNLLPNASYKLPNIQFDYDKDGNFVGYNLAPSEKMPFTITSASTYEGSEAQEVVSPNNIGYILGDKNVVHNDKVRFGERLEITDKWGSDTQGAFTFPDRTKPSDLIDNLGTIPRWFYKIVPERENYDTQYNTNIMKEFSVDELKEMPQDMIKEVLGLALDDDGNYVSVVDSSGLYTMDALQVNGATDNYQMGMVRVSTDNGTAQEDNYWSLHGMIEWGQDDNDKTKAAKYGTAYERDGFAADENGYYYDGTVNGSATSLTGYVLDDSLTRYMRDDSGNYVYVGGTGNKIPLYKYVDGVFLPNVGIWFRPANAGTIRLIMYSDSSKGGIALLKIKRPASAVAETGNKFAVDWGGADYINSGTAGITVESKSMFMLPQNVLFCFEFEVTDPNDGYEYWIMQANTASEGPKLVYMDIGASASVDDGIDTGIADTSKQVTAIDFIYDGIKILDHDILDENGNVLIPKGSFVNDNNVIYVESSTMISFGTDNGGAIVAFYYRKGEQPDADGKTINAAYNATDNSLVSSNTNKANITTTGKDVTVDGNLQNSGWTLP